MAKSKWSLDLDIKEFTEKAIKAKGTLENIGDAKNLDGLTRSLMQTSRLLAIVGTAALAVKGAFSAAFAFEKAETVNAQFDQLAKNAGLAADVIRNDLVNATGGLIDDEDAIKSASEQILKLGNNANKIPEIMDLARKRTTAFGGDMVQTFEQISQAVASGQVRQLRNLGIIVDQEKAYKQYAESVGKTVGILSQEERQRATLNAVLQKGNEQLSGIDGSTQKATLGWQKLSVTVSKLAGDIQEAIGKFLLPVITRVIDNLNVLADTAAEVFRDNFGSDAEKAAAAARDLAKDINELQLEILEAKAAGDQGGFFNSLFGPNIEKMESKLQFMKDQYDVLAKKAAEGVTPAGPEPILEGDNEKILEQRNKFEQEMIKLKQSRLDQELALSSAYIDQEGNLRYQGEEIQTQRIALLKEETAAKIRAIQENDDLLTSQKKQMIAEVEQQEQLRRIQMEDELVQIRQRNLDQYVKDATNAQDGVTRAFQAGAEQSRRQLNDWGQTGKLVFNSFKNQATQAFLAIGSGSMNAGEAIKAAMFGTIADTAEAKGQEMLLAGIYPPNPPAIAGGAGLIALAGLLRSKAQGASGGIGGGTGGGVGAPGGIEGAPVRTEAPDLQEAPKRMVSINVQGSYFETEQTQRRLVELIRQESDATDFSFRQIGG